MKKQILRLMNAFIAASTILILGGGCQEQMNEFDLDLSVEEDLVKVKDGTLHFQGREVFEDFMFGSEKTALIGEESFKSLALLLKDHQGNNLRLSGTEISKISEFEGTPLLDVLDSDGLVAIENYYICLDFDNETAGVTKNSNLVPLLRNKDFSHDSVQVYSFEEEVLGILFGNVGNSKYTGESNTKAMGASQRIMDCNTGTPKPGLNLPYRPTPPAGVINPSTDREISYTEVVTIGSYQYKIKAKHAYQAAAIYFRLKSELEHYRRVNDATALYSPDQDPFMSISYWGDFTPNNRATVTLDACYESCQGCTPPPVNRQKVQKIHWEAGRRLIQVNLHGIYRGRLGGSHAGFNAIPYEFRLVPINRN